MNKMGPNRKSILSLSFFQALSKINFFALYKVNQSICCFIFKREIHATHVTNFLTSHMIFYWVLSEFEPIFWSIKAQYCFQSLSPTSKFAYVINSYKKEEEEKVISFSKILKVKRIRTFIKIIMYLCNSRKKNYTKLLSVAFDTKTPICSFLYV